MCVCVDMQKMELHNQWGYGDEKTRINQLNEKHSREVILMKIIVFVMGLTDILMNHLHSGTLFLLRWFLVYKDRQTVTISRCLLQVLFYFLFKSYCGKEKMI